MSVNKVIVLGNIGRTPEVKKTAGGTTVCTFNVACTEKYTKDGQKVEETEWVSCVAYGKTGDTISTYFGKGSEIYIEGKMKTRSWEDKNGGSKRYATEVIVNEFKFTSGSKRGEEPRQESVQPVQGFGAVSGNEYGIKFDDPEDMPF